MRSIVGVFTALFMCLNLLFWSILLLTLAVPKALLPAGRLRSAVVRALAWIAEQWSLGNSWWFRTVLPTRWTLSPLPPISRDAKYLVISNHQSWVDIFALLDTFVARAPFIRFFLKKELIWVPLAGQACWALEFPFMKRHSQEYLKRHPEKRGSDLITTRKACARYQFLPVTVLNFLEGTRFTEEKRLEQRSPYRHLLVPKPGGLAFVLAALGDRLDAMLDVTLTYPGRGQDVTMWEFACGRVKEIRVDVREVPIPPEFISDAITETTPERRRYKAWLQEIWREKDELIEERMREWPPQ